MGDLKKQIQADAATVYHILKIITLFGGMVFAVVTFFPSRASHDALANDHRAFKSATEDEFANIREDNKKTIDLLCIMSVELIGKDAVVQYCTGRNK